MTPRKIHGERLDRTALIGRLAGAPERLANLVRASTDAASDGWTRHDIARHLLTVERVVWQVRLDQLAAGEQPRWPFAEPGTGPDDDRPLGDLVRAFRTQRLATLDRLAALDDAGWARTGDHETFGRLDVAGLCRIAADHDDEHLGADPA